MPARDQRRQRRVFEHAANGDDMLRAAPHLRISWVISRDVSWKNAPACSSGQTVLREACARNHSPSLTTPSKGPRRPSAFEHFPVDLGGELSVHPSGSRWSRKFRYVVILKVAVELALDALQRVVDRLHVPS